MLHFTAVLSIVFSTQLWNGARFRQEMTVKECITSAPFFLRFPKEYDGVVDTGNALGHSYVLRFDITNTDFQKGVNTSNVVGGLIGLWWFGAIPVHRLGSLRIHHWIENRSWNRRGFKIKIDVHDYHFSRWIRRKAYKTKLPVSRDLEQQCWNLE